MAATDKDELDVILHHVPSYTHLKEIACTAKQGLKPQTKCYSQHIKWETLQPSQYSATVSCDYITKFTLHAIVEADDLLTSQCGGPSSILGNPRGNCHEGSDTWNRLFPKDFCFPLLSITLPMLHIS